MMKLTVNANHDKDHDKSNVRRRKNDVNSLFLVEQEVHQHDERTRNEGTLVKRWHVGDTVWVKRTGKPQSKGEVAYLGPVHFANGDDWVGVILTDAINSGKNNGTIQGRTYFRTPSSSLHSGIFVRESHITVRRSVTNNPVKANHSPPSETPKRSLNVLKKRDNVENKIETTNQKRRRELLERWKSTPKTSHKKIDKTLEDNPVPRSQSPARQIHPLLGLSLCFATNDENSLQEQDAPSIVPEQEKAGLFSFHACVDDDEEEIEFDDRTGASTIDTLDDHAHRHEHMEHHDMEQHEGKKKPLFTFDESVIPHLPKQTQLEAEETERQRRLEALEKWKREKQQRKKSGRVGHPLTKTQSVPNSSSNRFVNQRRVKSCDENPMPAGRTSNGPTTKQVNTPTRSRLHKRRLKQKIQKVEEPDTPATAALSYSECSQDKEETVDLLAQDANNPIPLQISRELTLRWLRQHSSSTPGLQAVSSEEGPETHNSEESETNNSFPDDREGLEGLQHDLAHAQEVYNQATSSDLMEEMQHNLDAILESHDPSLKNEKNKESIQTFLSTVFSVDPSKPQSLSTKSCFHGLLVSYGFLLFSLVVVSMAHSASQDDPKSSPSTSANEEHRHLPHNVKNKKATGNIDQQ